MRSALKEHIILSLLTAAILLPFLGSVHLFDWDEINFAESAREMLVTGDWLRVQINFETFWEKPPLFMWLQAICMKVFGVNEFAARLPNAIAGIATMNVIWHIGRNRYDRKLSIWWVLIYLGSLTPLFYFKSGIIDPVFNLFIFLSCFQVFRSLEGAQVQRSAALAGLFLGLAVITKGPVAILITVLFAAVLMLLIQLRKLGSMSFPGWQAVAITLLTALGTAMLWYVPLIVVDGIGFIPAFIGYQLDLLLNPVASHGQPWFYHAVILLLLCFPAAVIALPRLVKSVKGDALSLAMVSLFWVVLVLFSLVTTKIVHYSSLCYLPLTYLAAHYVKDLKVQPKWNAYILLVVGLLLSTVITVVPMIGEGVIPIDDVKDKILRASLDQTDIWQGWEYLVGLGILATTLMLFLSNLTRSRTGILVGLCLSLISIQIVLNAIVPKVEQHTQNGIISYYEDNTDAYFYTYNFKSYAHYFYGKTAPLSDGDLLQRLRSEFYKEKAANGMIDLTDAERRELSAKELEFLTSGQYSRPVRIVCQVKKVGELRKREDLRELHPDGYSLGAYHIFEPR